jgi:hypothetical protein
MSWMRRKYESDSVFQDVHSALSADLIKSCDSLDPNLRYVEGRSQVGLNDLLQTKSTSESSSLPSNSLSTLVSLSVSRTDLSSRSNDSRRSVGDVD